MRKKLSLFILLFFALLSNVCSQQILTVEEAVAAALKNNYDILLLKNDSAVYALNDSYSYTGFLPTVNASTGLVFNNNSQNQRLADGSSKRRNGIRSDNLQSAVNLNWVIFDGFKLFATRDRLAELVKLGSLAIKNQMVNTVSDVIKTYYNVVRQKQQLKAIEEQMKLNEELVDIAEKKLSVGLGAKPELLQAKVDLNAQKAARLVQINNREKLREQLNRLISFKYGTVYEVSDSIPIDKSLLINNVLSNAAINSPALQLAAKNITISQITLRERKADRFPIVSFNSAYSFSRTNNGAAINNFTPLFNQNSGFNYGLGITLPIFNGFNVRRQIKEAKLDIQYQEISYDYAKFSAEIAVSSAYKDYLLQQQTLDLEEQNILLAKENVYIAGERLRLGITTLVELREAQQSLEESYDRLIAARYNAKVAETELKRLEGSLIGQSVNP